MGSTSRLTKLRIIPITAKHAACLEHSARWGANFKRLCKACWGYQVNSPAITDGWTSRCPYCCSWFGQKKASRPWHLTWRSNYCQTIVHLCVTRHALSMECYKPHHRNYKAVAIALQVAEKPDRKMHWPLGRSLLMAWASIVWWGQNCVCSDNEISKEENQSNNLKYWYWSTKQCN